MKILKQEKNGNQVVLEIEEEYSKLDSHMQKAYAEAAREIRIPGFRQGKVPADLIKKYVNEEAVIDRAVQFLVSEIYPDVITETKIRPVDYPNVEVKKLKKSAPIVFNIKVDVYPEIKLGSYKGLKLKKQDVDVAEDEVNKTIEFLKSGYAEQNKIPEDQVVLDDDFAKKISTMGTFDELKKLIRTNIEMEKKNKAESEGREEATKKLAEIVEAEIPNGMLEHEIEIMMGDLEVSLKRNKMTLDSYLSAVKKDREMLKQELKPGAETRIKAKLVLEKISEKEKLTIEDEEVDNELSALAEHSGKSLDEYKAEISPEMKESIKEYMLHDKAMKLVMDKAKEE